MLLKFGGVTTGDLNAGYLVPSTIPEVFRKDDIGDDIMKEVRIVDQSGPTEVTVFEVFEEPGK